MWICLDCKLQFPNPAERLINHTEVDTRRYEMQAVCPACGSDDIEPMKQCVCGGYRRSQDDYCERCATLGEEVRTSAIDTLTGAHGINYTDAVELLLYRLEDLG